MLIERQNDQITWVMYFRCAWENYFRVPNRNNKPRYYINNKCVRLVVTVVEKKHCGYQIKKNETTVKFVYIRLQTSTYFLK